MNYISVAQTAEKWQITPKRVQVLCNEGRIEGAQRVGNQWTIPETAEKPQEPSQYLPHRYDSRCVCYTGTHDNAPLKQWYDEIPEEERDFAKKYLALTEREGIAWGVIRGGMGSVAELFMAQMQDYLPARYSARMNEPGVVNELNWRWRLVPEAVNETLIRRIREITERYGRLPAADETEAGASGETAE